MAPDVLTGDDGGHVRIGMEDQVANSIIKKLGCSASRSRSVSCCIHRVPDIFHEMSKHSAYVPEAISIGPYHRGNKNLKKMEDCKLSLMRTLLARAAKIKFGEEEEEEIVESTGGEEKRVEVIGEIDEVVTTPQPGLMRAPKGWSIILKDCVTAIKKRETEFRECYSDPIKLNSKELVEIMVVDGLFTIEYFNVHVMQEYKNIDDPLLGKAWLKSLLYWDFLLLENQLPIFVLKDLFKLTADENKSGVDAFYKLVLGYFRISFPGKDYIHFRDLQRYRNAKHLLDVFIVALHPCLISHPDSVKALLLKLISKLTTFPNICGYCHSPETVELYRSMEPCKKSLAPIYSCTSIPGAVELRRSGVQFKEYYNAHSFLGIKFSNGVFEIPRLTIGDKTDRWLRNLIAYEQFGCNSSGYVTSYAVLMDCLISSAEDVELLRKKGILITHLGCDEQVASMFNKLCTHVIDYDRRYSQLFNEVDKYYKKRQHKWKATLKREYFHNPWSTCSFLAAVLLILLTVISTIFTTLAWVVPKS
ncbi:hypothetical protein MKW98_031364 [Papaver atlanticum]|uniref:Uncharacterized protein n=1 Tax=Papaver atlanticum TaxID=357466 RepID=A0AAD4S4W1_9MAGN|nr:hypothetical protein MKW98_031364 [Papaver atlanticum]